MYYVNLFLIKCFRFISFVTLSILKGIHSLFILPSFIFNMLIHLSKKSTDASHFFYHKNHVLKTIDYCKKNNIDYKITGGNVKKVGGRYLT